MEQYKVPQFIDRESKILGPITIRQLVMMILMGLMEVIMYFLIANVAIFAIASTLFISTGLALLFVPFNGRPLSATAASMVGYFAKPRAYKWRQVKKQGKKTVYVKEKPQVILVLKPNNIHQFSEFLDKKQM